MLSTMNPNLLLVSVLYILVVITSASSIVSSDDDHSNQVVQFDYYVLALTWPPSYCIIKKDQNKKDKKIGTCTDAPKVPQRFTIHGLWPSRITDNGPEFCSNKTKFIYTTMDAKVRKRATKDWLDISKSKEGETQPQVSSFLWGREWQKHGTCSNLDQDSYMTLTLDTYDKLLSSISVAMKSSSKGGTMDISIFRKDLNALFPGAEPKIVCETLLEKPHNQYLSEIRFHIKKESPYGFQSNTSTFCDLSKPVNVL